MRLGVIADGERAKRLKNNGCLINGVDSEEIIAGRIGENHLINSVIKIASHKEDDGYCFNTEYSDTI